MVINAPKVGTWQVRFTPYPPGQSVEYLRGRFYIVQKVQTASIKLPRKTNQRVLVIEEHLEGTWFLNITVNGIDTGETKTFSMQKIEIPLFEGNNEVLISQTDGISNSRVTLYLYYQIPRYLSLLSFIQKGILKESQLRRIQKILELE